MKTKKSGLVIFIIGAAYIFLMAFVVSWWVRPAYRSMSWDEVNQTIWSVTSPLFGLWASSVPFGAIISGIGILIYVRSRRSHIWWFGIGSFVVVMLDILSQWAILPQLVHIPVLFGIGGGLISVFFLCILWLWARRRVEISGADRDASDLQLIGYVFLLIAMWYLCGDLSRPYQMALAERPLSTPLPTLLYLVLGWLFLFLSHLKLGWRVSGHESGTPK